MVNKEQSSSYSRPYGASTPAALRPDRQALYKRPSLARLKAVFALQKTAFYNANDGLLQNVRYYV